MDGSELGKRQKKVTKKRQRHEHMPLDPQEETRKASKMTEPPKAYENFEHDSFRLFFLEYNFPRRDSSKLKISVSNRHNYFGVAVYKMRM